MSKIGSVPIQIPAGVQVKISKNSIEVVGKEGKLNLTLPGVLEFAQESDKIFVKAKNEEEQTKSLHGLFRQLLFNAIKGVDSPWEKKIEIVGTGYNVKLQGEDLIFRVGFSHPVVFKKVANIKFQVQGNNKVSILGADKQLVGQIAYQIRIIKRPDPYKGKGIKYEGEIIKLKPGKKVKTVGAAA